MIELEIQFFGAFRKYVPTGLVKIQLDQPMTSLQLKDHIHTKLCEQVSGYCEKTLVFESALATESCVLAEEDLISSSAKLALLPPVCGG